MKNSKISNKQVKKSKIWKHLLIFLIMLLIGYIIGYFIDEENSILISVGIMWFLGEFVMAFLASADDDNT